MKCLKETLGSMSKRMPSYSNLRSHGLTGWQPNQPTDWLGTQIWPTGAAKPVSVLGLCNTSSRSMPEVSISTVFITKESGFIGISADDVCVSVGFIVIGADDVCVFVDFNESLPASS